MRGFWKWWSWKFVHHDHIRGYSERIFPLDKFVWKTSRWSRAYQQMLCVYNGWKFHVKNKTVPSHNTHTTNYIQILWAINKLNFLKFLHTHNAVEPPKSMQWRGMWVDRMVFCWLLSILLRDRLKKQIRKKHKNWTGANHRIQFNTLVTIFFSCSFEPLARHAFVSIYFGETRNGNEQHEKHERLAKASEEFEEMHSTVKGKPE